MNVNWGWIKQRPHFLAEELSAFFEVDAYYQKHYKKGKQDTKAVELPEHLKLHKMFRLPKDEKFGLLKNINLKLIQNKLQKAEKKSDFIWYSKPDHVNWCKPSASKKSIKVYDCMDDMLAFPDVMKNEERRKLVFESEKELVDHCEIILASSQNLADKLKKRYQTDKTIHVVNNAMHFYPKKEKWQNEEFDSLKSKGKVITYVGTIAEWFEFDKVIKALDQTNGLTLVLFGPSSVKIPTHTKIKHLGTIEHRFVADVLDRSDALILPFEVNELIEAVNPVKLYEYISSGNFVIASRYGETLKFEPYAYLYTGESELFDLFSKLDQGILPSKMDTVSCRNYALANTWTARAKEITHILNSYDSNR